MTNQSRWLSAVVPLALFAALAMAGDVSGEPATPNAERDIAYEDRIAELERQVRVLAGEVERARMDTAVPEDLLEGSYGYGPAASKVYGLSKGLSVGGYGEVYYRNYVGDKTTETNEADFLRAVLYFGYKFTDSIIFNSELEIEHTDEISLEFATIDFLWKDYANLKTGLMLMPLGWLNELHEPPFFYGVNRPDVEQLIIPTTWRANGVGLFGSFGENVHYKLYGVNSFDSTGNSRVATGFSSSGVRGGRQKGSKAFADNLAATGRLDFTPLPGLIFGGSFFVGDTGQDQAGFPDALTTIFDLHAQWQWKNLWLRGLFAMAFVDNAGELSDALTAADPVNFEGPVAEEMIGGYAEIAYDIWGFLAESDRSLEPFYRLEYYDTQFRVPAGTTPDDLTAVMSHTVGLQFEPIPNVVLKADYRNREPKEGTIADEFNLGVGYVF